MRRIPQLAAVPLLLVGRALAHDGAELNPGHWHGAWSWEPGIIIPLAISAALYSVGLWRIYRRNSSSPAVTPWQAASFCAGWLTLLLALDSPVHKLGEQLFSVHMSQHELLMVIAAPLLAMGRPLIAFLFAFPERTRTVVGGWTKFRPFSATWKSLTDPLVVWILHAATIWGWHIPSLYESTLNSEAIHALQHLMFLGTALLFWYTLIHGRYGRLGYGVAFVYVFTTALHTSILGALMTFTQQLWYPIYDGRTAVWHLTPLQDQQLGGLIMWIPSGTVFIVVGLAMLAAWIGESERRGKLSRLAQVSSMRGGPDA
ncbi:MAG: cytochrome c oxidase assembly protein [Acidobacteriaceae bacterium]